jgi:SNF family Na+-dependent transporter
MRLAMNILVIAAVSSTANAFSVSLKVVFDRFRSKKNATKAITMAIIQIIRVLFIIPGGS